MIFFESPKDMLERVQMMSSGDSETWDLSENDCCALRYMVAAHEKLVEEMDAIRDGLRAYADDPILLGLQLRAIRALALAKGEK